MLLAGPARAWSHALFCSEVLHASTSGGAHVLSRVRSGGHSGRGGVQMRRCVADRLRMSLASLDYPGSGGATSVASSAKNLRAAPCASLHCDGLTCLSQALAPELREFFICIAGLWFGS